MTDSQRNIPINELDATFMTIEPAWGKEISEELNKILTLANMTKEEEEKAKKLIDQNPKKSLWFMLGIFTRDLRLGNLNFQEIDYVNKHIDLCNDLIDSDCPRAAITCFKRAITVNETSQSKGGFLRRQITTKTFITNNPPEQKPKGVFGLFGKSKNQGGNTQ